MRSIAIVGGKLQGMEACYLARHAGIRTCVIDIDPQSPARGMCDDFLCGDVIGEDPDVIRALREADMVLPAMENDGVLEKLVQLQKRDGFVLAFDMDAYRISSSKRASDAMFHRMGVPAPRYYPEGDFPYIAKEENGSGSHGTIRLDSQQQLENFLRDAPEDTIIQEYIEGPSYSIEIIGRPGQYRTYEITQIHVDEGYDCNLVTSPCPELTQVQRDAFTADAIRIAEEMDLHGIMDYEVILHDGQMKMLEIDARIPSQTPAAVLQSTGMNELEDLYDLFVHGEFRTEYANAGRYAAYEHYLIEGDCIESLGEHIMTEGGIMDLRDDFCGSDETQTDIDSDFSRVHGCYRVTFINSAQSKQELDEKRKRALECLKDIPSHKNAD